MTRLDRRALFATGSAAALLSAAGISSAETPARGGHLRIAVAEAGTLAALTRHALFDALVEIAPDGTLRGELATGWEPRAGGRVWKFTLRGDARFHDGQPCGAADVAASLTGEAIDRVEARPGAVMVHLHAPDPGLPLTLANRPIHPAGDPEGLTGTGLYQMTHHRAGRQLSARRVVRHYKDGSAGWAERLDVICLPDAQARAEAVTGGHVDIAVLDAPVSGVEVLRCTDLLLGIGDRVARPDRVGQRLAFDDARAPERWWLRS